MGRRLLGLGLAIAIGCTQGACVQLGSGGPIVGRYAGLVTVRAPGGVRDVQRVDVETVGTWLESNSTQSGAGMGWRRTRLVSIPHDCELIFIVETDAQLRAAEAFLSQIKEGEKPCAVKS